MNTFVHLVDEKIIVGVIQYATLNEYHRTDLNKICYFFFANNGRYWEILWYKIEDDVLLKKR